MGLYGGGFLEGHYLAGTQPFESWVEGQRARLSSLHRAACRELVQALQALEIAHVTEPGNRINTLSDPVWDPIRSQPGFIRLQRQAQAPSLAGGSAPSQSSARRRRG